MNATSGVAGVLTRINDIGNRFGAPTTSQTVVVDATPFDPFGAQYEAAMASAQQVPTSTTVTPTAAGFAQSYAPLLPTTGTSSSTVSTVSTIASVAAGTVESGAGARPSAPSAPTTQAIQLAIDGTLDLPGEHSIGGYGKIPVPPELAAFGNGKVPREQLAPVGQGGHRLWAPAAASWQNLVAAARADGVTMRITDSYRSYEEQVDLAERKGLYQNGGLAAVPGTSNHGWGMAVDADVRDPTTMAWLRTNGPRFGWVEAVTREPWHWEFRPSQV